MEQLQNNIDRIKDITILCIGDIMLDRFVYGNVNRISPEAPVQILNLKNSKEMLGGCGNVVANLSTLGCKTDYIGIVGNDEAGRKISKLLKKVGSHSHLLKLDDYSTIVKTRFIAGNNHILRLDEEEKLPIIRNLLPKYEKIIRRAVKKSDIVILSDYNKGVFTFDTTQLIIRICKQYGKKVIVDPKGNDYSKYSGATFVKPNLKEFSVATGLDLFPTDKDFDEKIQIGAKGLFEKCNIENLLVTMSEHGIMHISSKAPNNIVKLPTEAKEVFDVSGAGDTTIAVFTLSLALGLNTIEAMKMANIAAGIVVGKVGTACVSINEFKKAINQEKIPNNFTHLNKIISLEYAKDLVQNLQSKGKIVGFTNGCFDLLHLGHLNSFAQAKKHCDYLIVGINTDSSIKRLKGSSRPYQDEITRSNIVAALDYVDYVVLFDDDTALPLVEAIKPNVIAKEGYAIDNWPEAQFVESYGGKAITLPRLEGVSTTDFIKKLRGEKDV